MKSAACQLMRALRGSTSQVAFSRQLGYRSNVAAEWEGGRRFPHALELLRICEALEIDAVGALRELAPESAALVDPADLGPWLDHLRGPVSQTLLARRAKRSRHQIRRWLTGTAVPRIPDFLVLLDALTHRPATFASRLVDLREVPALQHRLPHERRRMAFLAYQRQTPVQRGLREAGLAEDALLVLPMAAAGLEALRALHLELEGRARRTAAQSGEPDAVAVLALGTARLT
ncbi:MAG: hypothetical protein H6737_12295 [Alphaproteobacteria bacterium]|nr:hypothetical protein [Alphaproteobacteria bacterium]